MASSNGIYAGMAEGQSTTRPPLFDGSNYSYWKDRMKIYLKSTEFKMWLVIENGEEPFTKIVDGKEVEKYEREYNEEEIKRAQLYARAINTIHCAVSPDVYNKLSRCKTAKEMWDKLEVTHEGTSQVRQSKIDKLTHEYELFAMKEEEKVDDMFERFSSIINNLDALGKSISEGEIVRKILRSLTPEWESKMNAIQESKDTNKLSYDELRGNLVTYEATQLSRKRTVNEKKKIALKATSLKEEESDDSTEGEKEEFNLMVRKFRSFLKKEKGKKNRKKNVLKCYGCGEIGHIKPKCPKEKTDLERKKGAKKQKTFMSWEDESEAESSDEEIAQLCLMAFGDESENDSDNQEVQRSPNDFTFDELLDAFHELFDEHVASLKLKKSLKKEIKLLKKNCEKISNEKDELQKENQFFKNDLERLVKENDDLKCENISLGKKCMNDVVCDSCENLKSQIANLEGIISKFNKP